MEILVILVPLALGLGLVGLLADDEPAREQRPAP
jgi:cbb3-type cytochrome oxidase maturation protein